MWTLTIGCLAWSLECKNALQDSYGNQLKACLLTVDDFVGLYHMSNVSSATTISTTTTRQCKLVAAVEGTVNL